MKKCMNMLSSNKIIGIQEAQYGLMQMPLTLSSELPYYLYTTTKMKLAVDERESTLYDLKTSYSTRNSEYLSMSLAEYFYKVHKKRLITSNAFRNSYLKDTNLELSCRNPILVPRGRNVRAVYPVTFEYARSMIIMYVPWSKNNVLDLSDQSKTVAEFERRIESKLFPTSVIAQYNRALFYYKHSKIEVVSKKTIPIDIAPDEENDEYCDYHIFTRAMNHFTNDEPVPCSIGDLSFNVGTDHDWTQSPSSNIKRMIEKSGDTYMDWIKKQYLNAYSSLEPNEEYISKDTPEPVRTLHFMYVLRFS